MSFQDFIPARFRPSTPQSKSSQKDDSHDVSPKTNTSSSDKENANHKINNYNTPQNRRSPWMMPRMITAIMPHEKKRTRQSGETTPTTKESAKEEQQQQQQQESGAKETKTDAPKKADGEPKDDDEHQDKSVSVGEEKSCQEDSTACVSSISSSTNTMPAPVTSARRNLENRSTYYQLTVETQHYQKIVADLESILNASTTSPEQAWRAQILIRSGEQMDRELARKLNEYEQSLALLNQTTPPSGKTSAIAMSSSAAAASSEEEQVRIKASQTACMKLCRDFKRSRRALETVLASYVLRQRAEVSTLSAQEWKPTPEALVSAEEKKDEDFYERAMRERQVEVEQVHRKMNQVNEIYQRLGFMVDGQQGQIDRLDENVQYAKQNVQAGVQYLNCFTAADGVSDSTISFSAWNCAGAAAADAAAGGDGAAATAAAANGGDGDASVASATPWNCNGASMMPTTSSPLNWADATARMMPVSHFNCSGCATGGADASSVASAKAHGTAAATTEPTSGPSGSNAAAASGAGENSNKDEPKQDAGIQDDDVDDGDSGIQVNACHGVRERVACHAAARGGGGGIREGPLCHAGDATTTTTMPSCNGAELGARVSSFRLEEKVRYAREKVDAGVAYMNCSPNNNNKSSGEDGSSKEKAATFSSSLPFSTFSYDWIRLPRTEPAPEDSNNGKDGQEGNGNSSSRGTEDAKRALSCAEFVPAEHILGRVPSSKPSTTTAAAAPAPVTRRESKDDDRYSKPQFDPDDMNRHPGIRVSETFHWYMPFETLQEDMSAVKRDLIGLTETLLERSKEQQSLWTCGAMMNNGKMDSEKAQAVLPTMVVPTVDAVEVTTIPPSSSSAEAAPQINS